MQELEAQAEDGRQAVAEATRQLQQERDSTEELTQQAAERASRLARIEGASCHLARPVLSSVEADVPVARTAAGACNSRLQSHCPA